MCETPFFHKIYNFKVCLLQKGSNERINNSFATQLFKVSCAAAAVFKLPMEHRLSANSNQAVRTQLCVSYG